MKISFRILCIAATLLFLAWIAKMHFVFGGDYLFRLATGGILISLVGHAFWQIRSAEIKSNKLTRLFMINTTCLFIAYLGMMMKVSHVMNTQLEKDLVLDFLGIPAILTSLIYNFVHVHKLLQATRNNKILFIRQIIFPWTLFIFSFLLYIVYSIILTVK